MTDSLERLTAHLLSRLREVQQGLGAELAAAPDLRFADALDSMGMAEFLTVLARDCRVTPTAIEECAGRHFRTVVELAQTMHAAGIQPREPVVEADNQPASMRAAEEAVCWLAAPAARLPDTVQHASAINGALQRPAG